MGVDQLFYLKKEAEERKGGGDLPVKRSIFKDCRLGHAATIPHKSTGIGVAFTDKRVNDGHTT
jgi:hypothetical protein